MRQSPMQNVRCSDAIQVGRGFGACAEPWSRIRDNTCSPWQRAEANGATQNAFKSPKYLLVHQRVQVEASRYHQRTAQLQRSHTAILVCYLHYRTAGGAGARLLTAPVVLPETMGVTAYCETIVVFSHLT